MNWSDKRWEFKRVRTCAQTGSGIRGKRVDVEALRRCFPRVGFQHAAERLRASDLFRRPFRRWLKGVAIERAVVEALMGAVTVVVRHVLGNEKSKMILAKDYKVVKTLDLERLNCPEPNCGRIRYRIEAVRFLAL